MAYFRNKKELHGQKELFPTLSFFALTLMSAQPQECLLRQLSKGSKQVFCRNIKNCKSFRSFLQQPNVQRFLNGREGSQIHTTVFWEHKFAFVSIRHNRRKRIDIAYRLLLLR